MKYKPIYLFIIILVLLWGVEVMALPKPNPLDKDCTPVKAAKNTAMKATVGVSGRCGPVDAAKDSAKKVVGVGGHKTKKNEKKDQDKEEHSTKKRLLN